LSFDNEDTIDKVVAEHFVNISGKQVEIKRAEPRDKSSGKSLTGQMHLNQMQPPGSGHPIPGSMPPWNAMWGPQPGPPPPSMPPPPPPQASIPGMPNGMPNAYPPAWNAAQQAYATGNGWTQPPNYQNYQQWAGYGYPPPQGWTTQGYSYGPYNTSYPGYGQTTAQTAANAAQAPVAQTPIAANAGATAGAAVGGYIQATGVAANLAPAAQQVIPNLGSSAPQTGAAIGTYPQEASNYGPARVGSYTSAPNYTTYALQGQGDAPTASAANYTSAATTNQNNTSYSRVSSQPQSYHPYRRV
jgi:RNA-binding protein Musashi